MKRLAALPAVLLVVAGCGGRGGPPEKPAVRVLPIEVLAVAPAAITATVTATAMVEARDDVPVSAEASGQVEAVRVKVGDWVEDGQVLVSLDEELASLGERQAEAQRLLAEAELTDAEANFKRATSLWKSGDISDAEYEASERGAKSARAALMAAEAAHGSAARQLRNTRIASPIAGYVAFVHAEEGHFVAVGTPVARVVNDSRVQIEIGLNEDRVVDVRKGQPAEIRVRARPGQVFEGRVEYVGPRADDMTKTYPVRILLSNPGRKLRAGMVAEVTIAADELTNVIVIERDWVVDRYGEPAVFVAGDSLAQLSKVTLGRVIGDRVVVLSGLSEGDRVVTLGYDQLTDGARIDVKNEHDSEEATR